MINLSSKRKTILFVSHVADRNGAPLILLGLIKEFKKQTGLPVKILLAEGGPLTVEFSAAGKTFIWEKKKTTGTGSITLARWLINYFSKLLAEIRKRYILFCIRDTGLVFFNTIVNGKLHESLLFLKCKYVCYVHELESPIHNLTNGHTLGIVLKNTDFFLTGSGAVRDNLIANHQVNGDIIKVVYSSIAEVYRDKKSYSDFISSFRQKNGIPADAVVIGAAASNEWRKGFDLFLPLISVYLQLYPESNVYFVWKGFRENNKTGFQDLYDYKKFNIKRAILLPHGSDNIEHFACFDIHLLLSREDPYPLVVLEAASLGIPTVCFTGAGGSPEFVEEDSGYCVPYGDLLKMAACLHELAEKPGLRNAKGLKAQQKVASHSQQQAGRDVIDVIKNVLDK